MPSFLESYNQIRKLCIPTGDIIMDLIASTSKKDYFFKHLDKVIGYIPPEYNDEVKCVLVALHVSGLGRRGDELQHVSNATKALANGFDPKNLPVLYKNTLQELTAEKRLEIFEQCRDTLHNMAPTYDTGPIYSFLLPEFGNTAGNEFSATVGDGSIAAGYDVGSAEHDVEISGNVPFGLD